MPLSSWRATGRPARWRAASASCGGAVEAGDEVEVAEERGVAGHQAGEDVDGGAGAERFAQRGAFLGDGDEEGRGAGGGERGGDAGGAEAVGVGLDHGGGLDMRGGERVEGAPVGGDGAEVDGEEGAGDGGLLQGAEAGRNSRQGAITSRVRLRAPASGATLRQNKRRKRMCRIYAGQDPGRYRAGDPPPAPERTEHERAAGGGLLGDPRPDRRRREGLTTPAFISKLHEEVLMLHGEARNFSSMLRCTCLLWLERQTPLRGRGGVRR